MLESFYDPMMYFTPSKLMQLSFLIYREDPTGSLKVGDWRFQSAELTGSPGSVEVRVVTPLNQNSWPDLISYGSHSNSPK